MELTESQLHPWQEFESQVETVFHQKGYMTARDIKVAGRQFDIVATSPEESAGDVLIECKFHEPTSRGRVGVAQVEDFASRVLRLRMSGDASSGYLVTNTDFTADAKGSLVGRPEGKFVFLRTFSELRRTMVDFSSYLRRYVDEYEAREIFESYEPLDVVPWLSWNPSEDSDEPPAPPGNQQAQKCDEVLSDFARDDTHWLLVLVGDYGTGKTTATQRLCYRMAKAALAPGYTGRIPIYIPLQLYNLVGTSTALVQTFLAQAGLRHAWYEAFMSMNDAGQFLLILDGFDEMAKRVTTMTRREALRDLSRLCGPKSKVILSGRHGFYPSDAEFRQSLEPMVIRSIEDRIRLNASPGESPSSGPWVSYELRKLTPAQIRSFLERRLRIGTSSEDAQQLVDLVISRLEDPRLGELARRPILLEMISQTLGGPEGATVETPGELYRRYVDLWLQIDADKGDFRNLITPEQRLAFAMMLACEFFL